MGEDTHTRGEINELIKATKDSYEPRVMDVTAGGEGFSALVLLAPPAMQVIDAKKYIDEARPLPERRKGTALLSDVDSFIAHVTRHQDADSVIFADAGKNSAGAKLVGVLDYNRSGSVGEARWGQHRAVYEFPFSEEWLAWTSHAGHDLGQGDFAEFMEDRLADVLEARGAGPGAKAIAATLGVDFAGPPKVLEVSRGLSLNVERRVANHVNTANGAIELLFAEEHTNKAGAALAVPGAFLIGIPVFKSGAVYQIPVRLRYRVREGKISWRFELYRTDRVFDDAFGEAARKAQIETSLPLFFGKPEA